MITTSRGRFMTEASHASADNVLPAPVNRQARHRRASPERGEGAPRAAASAPKALRRALAVACEAERRPGPPARGLRALGWRWGVRRGEAPGLGGEGDGPWLVDGQPRPGEDVLISPRNSWMSLGGLERDIAQTLDELAALNAQAVKLREKIGKCKGSAAKRRTAPFPDSGRPSSTPPGDVSRSASTGSRPPCWRAHEQRRSSLRSPDRSQAAGPGAFECEVRRGHVLDGHPQRLEDRDLVCAIVRPAIRPAASSPISPAMWSARSPPRRSGSACRPPRRSAPVRESTNTRARADQRGIHLPLIGPARADGADVRAGRDPLTLDDRLARRRDERDEIRAFHRLARRRRLDDRARRVAARLARRTSVAAAGIRAPDAHLAQRPDVRRAPRDGCAPARRIRCSASTPASGRASSRVETADTAAVRASVM